MYHVLLLAQYMPSPQTWDFMKYGKVPVGLYTGRLDFQIPIYHYKDIDFDIDIKLGYNSAGFVPHKPSGPLGLNWFINCGGVISRQINGVPDDIAGEPGVIGSKFFLSHGILKRWKDGSTALQNSAIESIQTGAESINATWHLDNGGEVDGYETTPDLFSFCFGEHRGSFMIDANGKVHIFDCDNSGTYKVDLSNMGIQANSNKYHSSTISIKTGDGYIYEFGGQEKYVEYVYPYYTDEILGINQSHKIILSWYLKSITAPNNRKVTFDYTDVAKNANTLWNTDEFPPDDGNYIITSIPQSTKYYYTERSGNWLVFHQTSGGSSDMKSKVQAMKTVYLTKVTIDHECTIDFSYSKKSTLENSIPTLKLDAINITDNIANKNIDQISFTMVYRKW